MFHTHLGRVVLEFHKHWDQVDYVFHKHLDLVVLEFHKQKHLVDYEFHKLILVPRCVVWCNHPEAGAEWAGEVRAVSERGVTYSPPPARCSSV